MSLISGSSVTGSSAADTGYQISRSLRFNKADSAYLNRTPGTASNRKTFTFSVWYKKVELVTGDYFPSLFSARSGGTYAFFNFNTSTDTLTFNDNTGMSVVTNNQFRDFSAWYHLVLRVDTTQATAANRVRIYINGTESTYSSATYPSQNADLAINSTIEHRIGAQNAGDPMPINGYMTEINFVDGQSLAPTDFGEFNTDTGVWEPIEYTGTYGTNGFYLNFSDNASTTTLGDDFSGNNNDWTTNNFSVTAGAGNDSLVDSPTRYGTDTGAGGEVRGNYCTWNPISPVVSTRTLTNGNLDASITGNGAGTGGTIRLNSGKWYWEATINSSGEARMWLGWLDDSYQPDSNSFPIASKSIMYASNGDSGLTNSAYGATYTTNDVIGCALDLDAGTATFYKNNVSQGTMGSGLGATNWRPMFTSAASWSVTANFGQRPFAYTAPSGFKALVTTNLPTPTIEDGGEYFNTVLWTGTGSGQSITGMGFQPDWLWFKSRNNSDNHALMDVVRGPTKGLSSNSTAAEVTSSAGQDLVSFDADGFTTGTPTNYSSLGSNGYTIVTWGWKANGAGSSNTAGTITSTVSANTTSGFSIVRFTGTDAVATVGHGLGAVPKFMILKGTQRSDWWGVYHVSLGNTKYLQLNTTSAEGTSSTLWNNTTPTSTVFTLADQSAINPNGELSIAYVFAEVPGYSAFGSYTGNGSTDGPFVYLGFRPRFILIKRSSATENWEMFDSVRGSYNSYTPLLYPNDSNAELYPSPARFDILSNGFKIRSSNTGVNGSGNTYIYACFAENPFSIALAR